MINKTQITPGEDYYGYLCRLFENNKEYDLTSQDIADIMNRQYGYSYGESKYRKQYSYFMAGRKYERSLLDACKNRTLIISDFHVPFNLPIRTFAQFKGKVDRIVFAGDILDCQSLSKFSKKYRVPFMQELVLGRSLLIDIITMIGAKEVHIIDGNHEARLMRYASDRVDEDVLQIFPESPFSWIVDSGFDVHDHKDGTSTHYSPIRDVLKDYDIHYDGEWYCKVGKALIAHPMTYSSSMLKTTEKAVEYFFRTEKDFDTVCLAHTHKLGSYFQGNIAMYEVGCCCDPAKVDYNRGRLTLPQQPGCCILVQNDDGSIIANQSKLITF